MEDLEYKVTSDGKKIVSVCMECTKVYAPDLLWPLPLGFVEKAWEQAHEPLKFYDSYAVSHGYCAKCYEQAKL